MHKNTFNSAKVSTTILQLLSFTVTAVMLTYILNITKGDVLMVRTLTGVEANLSRLEKPSLLLDVSLKKQSMKEVEE
jgi:hypothetical protein